MQVINSDLVLVIPALVGLLAATISVLISVKANRSRTEEEYEKLLKEYTQKIYEKNKQKKEGHSVYETHGTDYISNNVTHNNVITSKSEIELALHESMMRSHQKQALMHSRVQFYTGISMSILGFIFFVYIIYLSLDSSNNLGIGIKIASSLIFEAIAVIFLKESHKLRESSKEYHDSLSESKKQQESINIAKKIEDKTIQSIVQAQLSLHLIGIKSETIDVTKILEVQNKNEN